MLHANSAELRTLQSPLRRSIVALPAAVLIQKKAKTVEFAFSKRSRY
jgi:hypothetical protein